MVDADTENMGISETVGPRGPEGATPVAEQTAPGLRTTEAYVVLRQLPESQGGVWLAWLGLGSHQIPVVNTQAQPRKRGGKAPNNRRRRYSGQHSFTSLSEALEAATNAWGRNLAHRLFAIGIARGKRERATGVIELGRHPQPLDKPVAIILEQGDTRSAWDVAVTLPRLGADGDGAITGLRPTGECF